LHVHPYTSLDYLVYFSTLIVRVLIIKEKNNLSRVFLFLEALPPRTGFFRRALRFTPRLAPVSLRKAGVLRLIVNPCALLPKKS